MRKNIGDVGGLKYTISDVGLLQPIIVRRSGDGYVVVDGERRLLAMRQLAISELIVGREVIVDVEETEADARFKQIIANVQREDIDPVDLGHAFVLLKERYGYPYNEIAEIIGKTPHYVTSKVGLVKRLAPEVQELVAAECGAAKCTPNTSSYGMNLNVLEDIARLPAGLQKAAYTTIRSKAMPTTDALRYLRAMKKRSPAAKLDSPEPRAGGPADPLDRQFEKLDRDVEELAGCLRAAMRPDREEVLRRLGATLEKLSSLYDRLKVETADKGTPAGAHWQPAYGCE